MDASSGRSGGLDLSQRWTVLLSRGYNSGLHLDLSLVIVIRPFGALSSPVVATDRRGLTPPPPRSIVSPAFPTPAALRTSIGNLREHKECLSEEIDFTARSINELQSEVAGYEFEHVVYHVAVKPG